MDLLSVEERALVDIEVFARPRITAGHGHLAVAVAPVALAPVAGVVTDAGMRDGSSKNIRLCLEILCHEPTVARSDAADMQRVGVAVLAAEGFRSLNDVLGNAFADGVDMAGGKLLTEAYGTAGIDDEHHISRRGIDMMRIARL